MSERATHKFQFSSRQIATAARTEADYHEVRLRHWQERSDAALAIVEKTIGAKVVRRSQTNGETVDVVVDYGDREAWAEYTRAHAKMASHRNSAERYRTDEKIYRTQGDQTYYLDTEDVHHFHLGGEGREE